MASDWFVTGKTLGVALDVDAGTMLVSVDGAEWVVAFQDGCTPSAAAGVALFPALSVMGDAAKMRCNLGGDTERPMRHAAPLGYCAVGQVLQVPFRPPGNAGFSLSTAPEQPFNAPCLLTSSIQLP